VGQFYVSPEGQVTLSPDTSMLDVQNCTGLEEQDGPCALYAYRLGKNPNITKEAREAARQRARHAFLGETRGRSPHVRQSEIPTGSQGHLVVEDTFYGPISAPVSLQ